MKIGIVFVWIAAIVASAGCSGGGGGSGGGTSVHGIVSITNSHSSGGTNFGAFAIWINPAITFANPYDLADGTCQRVSPQTIGGTPTILDAGTTITLTTPAHTLDMPNSGFGYSVSGSASDFVAGGAYTVTAPGGANIQAFTQNLTAPSDLTVTSPAFGGPVTVSRTAPFAITWTSSAGTDPVIVSINQDDGNNDLGTINCKFADTGSATIAASDLSTLVASSTIPNGSTSISISKSSIATFNAPGAGTTAGLITSEWSYDANVP